MAKPTDDLALSHPTPLKDALSDQQYEDCAPCRIMGGAAFTGLGMYTWISGRKQLREREREILKSGSRFGLGGRRVALAVTSFGLVGMGWWRWNM